MRLALIFGTRPEIIKLAPIIRESRGNAGIEVVTVNAAQHGEVVTDALEWFDIAPDVTLAAGQPGNTLNMLSSRLFLQLEDALTELGPDMVLIQGDTTSVCVAAHAATNVRIPVAHLEAGLRSGDRWSPFPEELNRRTVSALASLHLSPTPQATANLQREGIDPSCIAETGNTVIDALLWTANRHMLWGAPSGELTIPGNAGTSHAPRSSAVWTSAAPGNAEVSLTSGFLPGGLGLRGVDNRRLALITCHRRENWGRKLDGIAHAVASLCARHPEVDFVWPLHPNPAIREAVAPILGDISNAHLLDSLPYPQFVSLLFHATLALSDSGGLQEEAPSLGTPVLVLRDNTERSEGIAAGCAKLIGTDPAGIVAETSRLLTDDIALSSMRDIPNPYGDGHAAARAIQAITSFHADA